MKVALVVHRYGAEVDGGSEALCREVAHGLAERDAVEVWTSCARDYLTWRDEEPEGTTRDGDVVLRRFGVDRPRRIRPFGALTRRLIAGPHTLAQELDWMQRQGPRTLGLIDALERERDRYDAFVFFTYLYYPVFFGLPRVAARSVLVPTAHDEPTLHLALFRTLFSLPRAFVFQTPEEQELVAGLFPLGERPWRVAGAAPRPPADLEDAAELRARLGIEGPLIACVGRVDSAKSSPELARAFLRHKRAGGAGTLVFVGTVRCAMPEDPDLRMLGWVSDREKWSLLAAADLTVVPSAYESLSLALLESLSVGTPVLAHGGSPVLRGQCERTGGGVVFESWEELPAALAALVDDPERRRALGEAGRAGLARQLDRAGVVERYREMIREAAS